MKPFKSITIIVVLGLLLAYGCYPGGPETVDDLTIVRTQYNTAYDFGSQKKYYMPDSMLFYTNIDEEDIDEDKKDRYEKELLESIKINLEARGYEREVDTANEIDLVVLPSAVLSKNTSAVWWPGGGWWGGYYPPGWGWGGGWYYPPGYGYWSYTSYTTGTVFITIADFDSWDPTDEQPSVEIEWDALIDGLIQETGDASKVDGYVIQAFEQSPYLMSN